MYNFAQFKETPFAAPFYLASEQKPPIGEEVFILTAERYKGIGHWDGNQWLVNFSNGEYYEPKYFGFNAFR